MFLDHATKVIFQRLRLPIHSKASLASCEYYATVIDGLQQKKWTRFPSTNENNSTRSSNPSSAHLPVTTPAQLARVAEGVNPLCSVSPKGCLMMEALIRETLMALCEDVVRRLVSHSICRMHRTGGERKLGESGRRCNISSICFYALPSVHRSRIELRG